MGELDLITGSWNGKVGKLVGAKWKDKHTLRSYAKPTYTNVPAQQRIRAGFGAVSKYLSLIAPQMKGLSSLSLRGQSIRNALIHLNKAEVEAGTLTPANLRLNTGGLPAPVIASATGSAAPIIINWTPVVSPIISAEAICVGVWYAKGGGYATVGSALNTAGTLNINPAPGAAAGDDVWLWLIDKRGSAKVGSVSTHGVTT